MYKVQISPEVEQDLVELPDAVLKEVFEYFGLFELDPIKHSGKLHNQGQLKLEGYRKTYVAKATYRIVIKIEDGVAKIVEVVAVGKRDNKEVYIAAHERINKQ